MCLRESKNMMRPKPPVHLGSVDEPEALKFILETHGNQSKTIEHSSKGNNTEVL